MENFEKKGLCSSGILKKKSKISNLIRIFFNIFWAKSENSKIAKIYFLWTSSEPILSKIWDNFFSKKKASVVVGFWKKPKFRTWIGFFSTFFEQNQKTRKLRKFIFSELHLSQFWARFIFEKKGLCSSGILKKKSKNFPNFKLEIGFFSDFAKKVANIPKLRKFICPEFHLSQFSAKSENLFWSGGREGGTLLTLQSLRIHYVPNCDAPLLTTTAMRW